MTIARVQHIYRSISGIPRDNCVNTFHFTGEGPLDETVAQELVDRVSSFYNFTGGGQTVTVDTYMATAGMMNPREQFKVYDITGAPPHAPVLDTTPVPPTVNATVPKSLPNEVALALSYAGAPGPGLNPARRRGRIFLGPVSEVGLASAGGLSRPTSNFVQNLAEAGKRFWGLCNAAGWPWCIHSQTDGTFIPVATCSVDDAWDVQRRRGLAPTYRFTPVFV